MVVRVIIIATLYHHSVYCFNEALSIFTVKPSYFHKLISTKAVELADHLERLATPRRHVAVHKLQLALLLVPQSWQCMVSLIQYLLTPVPEKLLDGCPHFLHFK